MVRLQSGSEGFRASSGRKPRLIAFCRALPRSSLSPTWREHGIRPGIVLFLTRWFGVTGSDADRRLTAEPAITDDIVDRILVMQTNVAAQQHCPLARGTHAKGICARARFEVL